MITGNITLLLIAMILVGIFAGSIGSVLGIGGGMIVTPVLSSVIGLDIKYSIAASLIVVIATSSGSTISYLKDETINLRVAMFLEVFTVTGGLCGAFVTGILPAWILYALFSCLIIFSIISMLKKLKYERKDIIQYNAPSVLSNKLKFNSYYYDKNLNKKIYYNVSGIAKGSIIMVFAGLLSGLLGIGSGVFKVIAMDNAMKMPLKPSTATSNLMMGVTATASAIVYFFNNCIIPEITATVVIGVLIGATIGSKIMPKMHPAIIRVMFIVVMVVLCFQMLSKAVMSF